MSMKKKKALFTALFAIVGCGLGLALRPPGSFQLREVIFTSPPRWMTEQDLLRLSEIQQGQNLLKVSLRDVRRKMLRYPWVKDVRLARTFPGRIQISVIEQEPVALLDLGDLYLINKEGEIFKKVSPKDPRDLPLLTGFHREDFENGGSGADRLVPLLSLLMKAQKMPIFSRVGISEINEGPQGLSLFTVSPVMRLYLGEQGWEAALARFEKAADAMLASNRKPVFIDLSFSNRIFLKRRG